MALVYGSAEYYKLMEEFGIQWKPGTAEILPTKTPAKTGGFWSFDWVGPLVEGGLSSYGKILQLQTQQQMTELQMSAAKLQLANMAKGQTVSPTFGGLNAITILSLAGVALLAMVILKK